MSSAAIATPGAAGGLRVALPDAVDAAFVLAAGMLALSSFGAAYGGNGYLVAGGFGLLIGAAVAYAGTRLRQPVLLVGAEAVLAYFLLGGAVAARGAAAGGVLPTPASIRALGATAVRGWRELLTISPVVGNTADLLVIPLLCGTVTGLAAMLLARRAGRWPLALVPPVVLLGAGILFGTDVTPSTVLTGGAFAAVLVAYGAWRARGQRVAGIGSASRLRPALAGVLVVGAAAAGVGLSPHVPLSGSNLRFVLRDHVTPPFDVNTYPSPLAGYRAYVLPSPRGAKTTTLLSVSGVPAGTTVLLRFATMDAYDGHVFEVAGGSAGSAASGNFASVGSPVSALPCPPAAPCGAPLTLTVQVGDYGVAPAPGGVWLPDAGIVRSVTFSGPRAAALRSSFRYNVATNTAVDAAGLQPRDTYTMVVDLPQEPATTSPAAASQSAAAVSLPAPQDLPQIVGSKAKTFTADAQSDFGRALALETTLLKGAYSDGDTGAGQPPTLPGHGPSRILAFLGAPQPVGDAEQYAASMALMADELGLPARVVLGAVLQGTGGTLTVQGSSVQAWVEIDFDGLGWYPFFPTPPKSAKLLNPPKVKQVSSTSQAHQYVAPVAPLPGASATAANAAGSVSPPHVKKVAKHAAASDLLAVVLLSLAGLAVLLSPVLLVLATKARRRARRRRAADPSAQIAGGWAEVLDRARDLGRELPRAGTRREQAGALGGSTRAVALVADRAVFGPARPAPAEVEAFWTKVDGVLVELGRELPAWRRARARVSTASLRGPRGA